MGLTHSKINKINYEDVQFAIKNKEFIIINTMDKNNQDCLITNTINYEKEEMIINKFLDEGYCKIIIYGKNTNDDTIIKKYNQLLSLGFKDVYVYPGGIFEWLCLQDIYGSELFPTTKNEIDILKFKPTPVFNLKLLTN